MTGKDTDSGNDTGPGFLQREYERRETTLIAPSDSVQALMSNAIGDLLHGKVAATGYYPTSQEPYVRVDVVLPFSEKYYGDHPLLQSAVCSEGRHVVDQMNTALIRHCYGMRLESISPLTVPQGDNSPAIFRFVLWGDSKTPEMATIDKMGTLLSQKKMVLRQEVGNLLQNTAHHSL